MVGLSAIKPASVSPHTTAALPTVAPLRRRSSSASPIGGRRVADAAALLVAVASTVVAVDGEPCSASLPGVVRAPSRRSSSAAGNAAAGSFADSCRSCSWCTGPGAERSRAIRSATVWLPDVRRLRAEFVVTLTPLAVWCARDPGWRWPRVDSGQACAHAQERYCSPARISRVRTLCVQKSRTYYPVGGGNQEGLPKSPRKSDSRIHHTVITM